MIAAAHGGAGIVVDSVMPGTPAEAAGLLAGDQLLLLAGRKVATMDDLEQVMEAHRPGDTVPLVVRRDGKEVALTLTFGERPGGGVSIGVRLNISMAEGAAAEPTRGTIECLAWIDETYRIEPMARELGLNLSEDYATLRSCVEHDTQRMSSSNAIKYCDNVFKVHCSGIDMLTEIGEAQVERCEAGLTESLGLNPKRHKGWTTCGQHKVFERYARDGEPSDADACRAAFLDECGTQIDAVAAHEVSSDQHSFAKCCSADALGSDSGLDCGMIDDDFRRGPCRDRPVCVNRLTSEWLQCSALQ